MKNILSNATSKITAGGIILILFFVFGYICGKPSKYSIEKSKAECSRQINSELEFIKMKRLAIEKGYAEWAPTDGKWRWKRKPYTRKITNEK